MEKINQHAIIEIFAGLMPLRQNILKNFASLVNRKSPRAFFLHRDKAVKAVGW